MTLLRHTMSFGAMTLISRILGFVRDVVLARFFGAGPLMDAFVVAFKIPNFLRRLFAEGSFSLAFVPVLNQYKEQGDHAALKALVDATAGSLLAVLMIITALGIWGAEWVIRLFAPGFIDDPMQLAVATEMLRITFPYLMLIALTALAGGILNTLGQFALPAVTPALLNIALIMAAVWGGQWFDPSIKALAWGVLVAGIAQLVIQLPVLIQHRVLPKPWPRFNHPGVRRILRLMVPTLLGSSVAQINLLLDTLLASLLMVGSISWLYYADRLMEFPLGLFGVALSTVILPTLSRLHARSDGQQFQITLNWAWWMAWLVGLPCAVGLALLAEPIITTLFFYGAFAPEDVTMAASALMAYCIGLPGFIAVKVLSPAFFSRQDAKTPVKVAVIALVTNMVLNVTFVFALAGWAVDWDWADGMWSILSTHPGLHVGLATASSVTGWLNAALLWRHLKQRGLAPTMPWVRFWQVSGSALIMTMVVVSLNPSISTWLDFQLFDRVMWLVLLVTAGVLSFAMTLWISGVRPSALSRPQP